MAATHELLFAQLVHGRGEFRKDASGGLSWIISPATAVGVAIRAQAPGAFAIATEIFGRIKAVEIQLASFTK